MITFLNLLTIGSAGTMPDYVLQDIVEPDGLMYAVVDASLPGEQTSYDVLNQRKPALEHERWHNVDRSIDSPL